MAPSGRRSTIANHASVRIPSGRFKVGGYQRAASFEESVKLSMVTMSSPSSPNTEMSDEEAVSRESRPGGAFSDRCGRYEGESSDKVEPCGGSALRRVACRSRPLEGERRKFTNQSAAGRRGERPGKNARDEARDVRSRVRPSRGTRAPTRTQPRVLPDQLAFLCVNSRLTIRRPGR